ncbi:MAG: TRAM domain-containing protein [bacterium]
MTRFIRALFYVIMTVFGILLGYKLAGLIRDQLFSNLTLEQQQISFFATGCVITLLSIVLSPLLANLFMRITSRVAEYFQKISFPEMIMGTIGLIIGLIISTLVDLVLSKVPLKDIPTIGEFLAAFIYLLVTIFICYLGIFITTRVLYNPSTGDMLGRGGLFGGKKRPTAKVLDTSVIIDGRFAEIYLSGFVEGDVIVPRFVLDEMQQIADSADALRRNRGRRGLDMLTALQKEVPIRIVEKDYPDGATDARLVKLCQETGAVLVTTDFNLNKVAQLQGIKVLNVNELANALKPVFIPGEEISLHVIREGKEPGQGVSYLDDGTMVVIEDGKRHIGKKVAVEVTSVLQTMAGKMVFARTV